jgi:pimeloyl-ACP methyl ester carboxylesterase
LFDELVAELARRHAKSVAVDFPGHGKSTEPHADLYGDAAAVRRVLDDVDGPIVVLAHSYGGSVVTIAADQHPRVKHLVYLAANMPDVGETVFSMHQHLEDVAGPAEAGRVDASLVTMVDGTIGELAPEVGFERFYQDCPLELQQAAVARLCRQNLESAIQPTTVAAWHTIPSTYVVCSQDLALPPSWERLLAKRATEVLELDSSHSPFLSMPDKVADVLEDVARTLTDLRHGAGNCSDCRTSR